MEGEAIAETVQARRTDISHELADVLYWTLLMARDLNIDLGEALGEKLLVNARKYPVAKARERSAKYDEL